MAVDMFLKIGDIKGESQDSMHNGSIDILSWGWGMANNAVIGPAKIAVGKVEVQDLTLTKLIDASSTELMLATCAGIHFGKAKFTIRKSGGSPLEYLVIDMEKVLITSVSTGGTGADDRVTETLSLRFAKMRVNYTVQDSTGNAGAKLKMGWDIQANAAY